MFPRRNIPSLAKNVILFSPIFLLIFSIFTFPLMLNFNSLIPGFFSTDEPFATLWDSWRIKNSLLHGMDTNNTNFIAFPFGIDLYGSGFVSYSWLSWLKLLSFLFSNTVAYNLQILINVWLAYLIVFLLVYFVSKDYYAAFIGAVIFAFSPFENIRAWQHIGLTYIQWLPLSLLVLFKLKDEFSFTNKVFLFLAFLLILSFEWSLMLISVTATMTFVFYQLFFRFKNEFLIRDSNFNSGIKFMKTTFLVGFLSLLILSPQFYPIFKNLISQNYSTSSSAFNPYLRPFEDLFEQSARPLSYLLPPVTHPIFGKFTEQFVGTKLYGVSFTEHTLYLGWTPLILAFVVFRRWRKIRKGQSPWAGNVNSSGGDSPYYKENFYIGFFILLAIVAWLFSQPPWWKIGPIKIYMPSFFMYKILPMFRAYCRFGIMLMLAIAVLAGFGLKSILEKFKSQKTKIILTCLFSGLVLFEFWNWPPYKVIDVSKVPMVYYWLKEQPGDFAIAEYPLDADSPNEMYKFYQTKHEKKIINGTIPGTYANKVAKTITKLSEPKTSGVLKWMGVRYVLVHRQDYIDTGLIDDSEELNKIPQNSRLKLIKSFPAQECPKRDIMCVQKTGPIEVYEVVAQPIVPEIKESGS